MPARSHYVGATPPSRSAGLWRVAARFVAAALAVALSIALFSTLARADGALGLEFDSDGDGCYVTSNGDGREPYITGEQLQGSCFVVNHSAAPQNFVLTMAIHTPQGSWYDEFPHTEQLGKFRGTIQQGQKKRIDVHATNGVLPTSTRSGPASVIFTITPSSDRYTSTLHHVIFVAQRNEDPSAYPYGPPKVLRNVILDCSRLDGNGPVSVDDEISMDCGIAGDLLPSTVTYLTYHVLDSSATSRSLSQSSLSTDRKSETFSVSHRDIPMRREASDGHARLYVEAWTSIPNPPDSQGRTFYTHKTLDWELIPIHIDNPAVPGPTVDGAGSDPTGAQIPNEEEFTVYVEWPDDSDDDSGDDPVDTAPTTTTASSGDVRLDYDGSGLGCQISDADGDGQLTYQRNQQVLLSCPVTNPDTTSQNVLLMVELRHPTKNLWLPVWISAKVASAPPGTGRQEARFSIPSRLSDGRTTADIVLFIVHQGRWVEQDRQTTEFVIANELPFRMTTPPAFDRPQAFPGSTVTVRWQHKNPFGYAITDNAHLELSCADGVYARANEPINQAANATTDVSIDLHIADDAPTGSCRLDFSIFDDAGGFVEGWTRPLAQRDPHARISLEIISLFTRVNCWASSVTSSIDSSDAMSSYVVVECKIESNRGGQITFDASIQDAERNRSNLFHESADVIKNATTSATFRVPISQYLQQGSAGLEISVSDARNNHLFGQTIPIEIPAVSTTAGVGGCDIVYAKDQLKQCFEEHRWKFWKTAACVYDVASDLIIACTNELADAIDEAVEWIQANVGGCLFDFAEGAIEGAGAESTSWCTIIGDFGMAVIPVVGDLRDAVHCVLDSCTLAEWALNIAGAVPIAGKVVDIASTASRRFVVKGVAKIEPEKLQDLAAAASKKNPKLNSTKTKLNNAFDDAIATVPELTALGKKAARANGINEKDLIEMVTAAKNEGARVDFKKILKKIEDKCTPGTQGRHCYGSVIEVQVAIQ